MAEIEQSELLERLETLKFKAEALYNFVPSLQKKVKFPLASQMIFDDLSKGIVSLIDEIES